ncbi:hypothetical protein EDD21DRAFT_416185 [Dissophora ornata]|nr:hypothetical protein EDD21DRAFT_416185 [Dissophora ornata]
MGDGKDSVRPPWNPSTASTSSPRSSTPPKLASRPSSIKAKVSYLPLKKMFPRQTQDSENCPKPPAASFSTATLRGEMLTLPTTMLTTSLTPTPESAAWFPWNTPLSFGPINQSDSLEDPPSSLGLHSPIAPRPPTPFVHAAKGKNPVRFFSSRSPSDDASEASPNFSETATSSSSSEHASLETMGGSYSSVSAAYSLYSNGIPSLPPPPSSWPGSSPYSNFSSQDSARLRRSPAMSQYLKMMRRQNAQMARAVMQETVPNLFATCSDLTHDLWYEMSRARTATSATQRNMTVPPEPNPDDIQERADEALPNSEGGRSEKWTYEDSKDNQMATGDQTEQTMPQDATSLGVFLSTENIVCAQDLGSREVGDTDRALFDSLDESSLRDNETFHNKADARVGIGLGKSLAPPPGPLACSWSPKVGFSSSPQEQSHIRTDPISTSPSGDLYNTGGRKRKRDSRSEYKRVAFVKDQGHPLASVTIQSMKERDSDIDVVTKSNEESPEGENRPRVTASSEQKAYAAENIEHPLEDETHPSDHARIFSVSQGQMKETSTSTGYSISAARIPFWNDTISENIHRWMECGVHARVFVQSLPHSPSAGLDRSLSTPGSSPESLPPSTLPTPSGKYQFSGEKLANASSSADPQAPLIAQQHAQFMPSYMRTKMTEELSAMTKSGIDILNSIEKYQATRSELIFKLYQQRMALEEYSRFQDPADRRNMNKRDMAVNYVRELEQQAQFLDHRHLCCLWLCVLEMPSSIAGLHRLLRLALSPAWVHNAL